jgi:Ser/Thr protein kinase RdoA (MazF antagonist)
MLGKELNSWKKNLIKLEHNLLFHLQKNNFPYYVPIPLKNSRKKTLSKLDRKHYWIYKKLDGKTASNLTDKQLKEIAKAMATYHKCLKDFKFKKDKNNFSLKWTIEKDYKPLEEKLAKIKNPNKLDKLMIEYFPLFKELLLKIDKMDFLVNVTVIHDDLLDTNVLFEKDKLVGIIDFDNLKIAPRIEDVAYTLRVHAFDKKGDYRRRIKIRPI